MLCIPEREKEGGQSLNHSFLTAYVAVFVASEASY